MWGSLWREAVRELQTTVGRRRSSRFPSASPPPESSPTAPLGRHGIVLEEADGWDVVGLREDRKHLAEVVEGGDDGCMGSTSAYASGGAYLRAGEAGASDEEDEEYRRIWNLPPKHLGAVPSQAARAGSNSDRSPVGEAASQTSTALCFGSDCAGAANATSSGSATRGSDSEEESRSDLLGSLTQGGGLHGVRDDINPAAAEEAGPTVAVVPIGQRTSMGGASAQGTSTFPAVGDVCPADASANASSDAAHVLTYDVGSGLQTSDGVSPEHGLVRRRPLSSSADLRRDAAREEGGTQHVGTTSCDMSQSPRARADRDGACISGDGLHRRAADGRGDGSSISAAGVGSIQAFTLLLVSLVVWLATAVHHIGSGLLQANNPGLVLKHALIDPVSRKTFMRCLLLNVGLFRGALFLYEVILPSFCEQALGVTLAGDGRYEWAVFLLWTLPAYLVCEIVSTSWQLRMHSDMASRASAAASRIDAAAARADLASAGGGRGDRSVLTADADGSVAPATTQSRASDGVLSLVYGRLIYIAFLMQVKLIASLPFLGPSTMLLLSSLLHAYDSFEMHWGGLGLGVASRFRLIEAHWLYFVGYGGVLAALSAQLRFWDLFTIRAVLYPIYIANAPHANFRALSTRRLPVFQACFGTINAVLQLAEMRMRPA